MDDRERAVALRDIAASVISRRAGNRGDVALRLLAERGTVTDADIDAALDATGGLTPQQLADLVATKCAAAIEHCEREVVKGEGAVDRARDKLARCEETAAGLVESARLELEALETDEPTQAEAELERARELLAAAVDAGGRPSAGLLGAAAAALAGVAEGRAS